jgi:hypothetical protein
VPSLESFRSPPILSGEVAFMKTPSFKKACEWIALNDEPEELEVEAVEGYLSTQLVADIFGRHSDEVALKIVRIRLKKLKGELK